MHWWLEISSNIGIVATKTSPLGQQVSCLYAKVVPLQWLWIMRLSRDGDTEIIYNKSSAGWNMLSDIISNIIYTAGHHNILLKYPNATYIVWWRCMDTLVNRSPWMVTSPVWKPLLSLPTHQISLYQLTLHKADIQCAQKNNWVAKHSLKRFRFRSRIHLMR